MHDDGTKTSVSAADLRAELARAKVPLYIVAARVGIHPLALGRMLNERRGLRRGVAERVLRAIAELKGE